MDLSHSRGAKTLPPRSIEQALKWLAISQQLHPRFSIQRAALNNTGLRKGTSRRIVIPGTSFLAHHIVEIFLYSNLKFDTWSVSKEFLGLGKVTNEPRYIIAS